MSTITPQSALNEKRWAVGLHLEAELAQVMGAFDGTEQDDAFQIDEKAQGNARGSTLVRRFARINHDEKPKGESDATLGQESQTTEYEDSMEFRYLKFDGKVENYTAEQPLVSFNLKSREVSRLALQWAYTFERAKINQLVGNTLVNTGWTNYGGSGCNIVTAQDAAHIYLCQPSSGSVTTEAGVAGQTSAVLDTRVIDDLVTQASSRAWFDWPIVPANTPFGPLYILVCHGTGFQQIKENSSGSDLYDIHKAAIQGGLDLSDSPLISGEGFIYNNTLVLKSDYCPKGITSAAEQANTRCAAFFGANAGGLMYAESFSAESPLGYSEHQQHRRLSMLTDTVYGFKRTIVNSQSWAAMRVVHYSSK